MTDRLLRPFVLRFRLRVLIGSLVLAVSALWPTVVCKAADTAEFREQIQPFLQKFCLRCHNADEMQSGIRVDQLAAEIADRQIPLWKGIQQQIADGAMPPEDEPQPSAKQRQQLEDWITRGIAAARKREIQRNGSVRRLTVPQYRNTLRELLGLREDLTDTLPPDAISKDGFTNNAQTLDLSPLQAEAYFNIAEKALDLCLVDEAAKPTIQNFRMEFGTAINSEPCPDKLVLGANSELLGNADFVVTELRSQRPFDFTPFAMQRKFEFIEGYVGNDTIRAWKKFDSLYHAVFACVRGTPGYPKGLATEVSPAGLLLRPAIPSPEIFGQSNTYGPMANFKISLRELPDRGDFRVTVKAARANDGLLLDAGSRVSSAAQTEGEFTSVVASADPRADTTVMIPQDGIYQVEIACSSGKSQGVFSLQLGDRHFAGLLAESKAAAESTDKEAEHRTAFLAVRLAKSELKLRAKYGDNSRLRRVLFHRLADDSELARRFQAFEKRVPSVGVHVGLRRDCGSTLTPVGDPQAVPNGDLVEFRFEGAINDFPTPDVEKDNVNYLAGVREIGVRSEYTDGRDMPRLLVKSIEFEGPLYDAWPPATHRNIFIDSPHCDDPAAYARDILSSFATRAFRRPVTATELDTLVKVWQASFNKLGSSASDSAAAHFQKSVKDALLVVLISPQFLFVIESSNGPQAEDLDGHELASKLSYLLWNGPPDARLLELAAANKLHDSLDAEIDRMIGDPRFGRFATEFTSQWLSLDKFDVVAVDAQKFPRLTRDTKTQLRQEPIQFLRHLIEHNLPLRNLIDSEFVVANEITASYYGLGSHTESGFRFVPIAHDNEHLGGVLTQASILSGLSDGRESNPVKRGAWFARKMIATPPDDPPPNVPKLPDDPDAKLTLREKLERHRNQKGCVKCHTGIDPWGLPFEAFDAGGLWHPANMDTRSKLPDGKEVTDLNGLRSYLVADRLDQVAFSVLKHFAAYANGRSLTYNETMSFQESAAKLKSTGYPMRDLLRFVIKSDTFLKK